MIKKTGILICVGLGLFSCVKETTVKPDDCEETVSFQDEVLPEIFNMSCNSVVGCHGSADAAAGYVWENYEQIAPNAELISTAINRDPGVAPMPLDRPKLAEDLIQKFDCWIAQGKLDN